MTIFTITVHDHARSLYDGRPWTAESRDLDSGELLRTGIGETHQDAIRALIDSVDTHVARPTVTPDQTWAAAESAWDARPMPRRIAWRDLDEVRQGQVHREVLAAIATLGIEVRS